MVQTSKIAYLLERLSQGVAAHDRENPGHHTWGIGMTHFDIERLGLEEGEDILPGIVLRAVGAGYGRGLVDASLQGRAPLRIASDEPDAFPRGAGRAGQGVQAHEL